MALQQEVAFEDEICAHLAARSSQYGVALATSFGSVLELAARPVCAANCTKDELPETGRLTR